jgi:hypothetical protein
MTTVLEIKTGVRSYTGDLDGVLFTDADILRYINAGIGEIVKRTRCLQTATIVTGATLIATDMYGGVQLPADFLIELDVYYGPVASATRLGRLNFNKFASDTIETGTGAPTMYAIGNYDATGRRILYFYPWMTPGLTNQSYIVRYIPAPVKLTVDGDTVPTPGGLDEVLTMYAVRRCKIQESDFQAAQFLQGEIDQKVNEFTSFLNDHGELSNFQLPEETAQFYSVFEV